MLYSFLPAIILLGVITSYEDIKYGKIRNKWIIFALVYAITAYIVLITYYHSSGGINTHHLVELITNTCFAVITGFGMWYFGLWTAGDGKLFIAFSALIPLSVYRYGYHEWIPSITLLINTFIFGLIFMLGLIIYKSKFKNLKKVFLSFLKNFFQPKQLLNSVTYLFAIFWLVGLLLVSVGITDYILKIVITILFMSFLQKKLGKKAFYIMLVIASLRLLVDRSVYSFMFLKNFLILVLIWRFIISFVMSGLEGRLFSDEMDIKDLKPGMLISQKKKEKIVKLGLKIESEGLTKRQIKKIKDAGIKKIMVAQTIPFAPFMFLGVLSTILAKGNILIVIKVLF